MTTKHTPGPWTMHPRFSDGAEVRSIAQVAWCGAAAAYGESGNQNIDAAEACANARLIAAAPDLLAVCEGLVAWWKADGISGNATLDALSDKARAAVAKAKGTKP